jgi:predicted phosphodiesterase
MIITLISDTHNKHNQVTEFLPGGDLLIHAGDTSSMGYKYEIQDFLEWFNSLDTYTNKIFIAGNHDWGFQINKKWVTEELKKYPNITYLEDNLEIVNSEPDYQKGTKIWGSPWQPEFYDWAFNLPRNGEELKEKWDMIPNDIDILITHGPVHGHVDRILGQYEHLGCELLRDRLDIIKPKIHVCGHIHSGYGYIFNGNTHFINASVLGENYQFTNKPLTIDWDKESNSITFL